MISNQISTVLRQAQLTSTLSNTVAETTTLSITFITPVGQYIALGVTQMLDIGDYVGARSPYIMVKARLQPSIYLEHLLKYRDALTCQLVISSGYDRVMREYTVIPLLDKDLRSESNSSIYNNLEALDETNIVVYEFQLIEKGYAKIRNYPVSNIYQVANVRDALFTVLEEGTKAIGLTGYETYKGLNLYEPIDNTNNFRQIVFPSGTRLKDAAQFLQEHNEHGVYSKGIGSFYKQNQWWVYPLFNTERVKTHPRPINLIRVPENKIPDLQNTFYLSPTAFTIISTGKAEQTDGADIRMQNQGTGQRVIMGDAISGDTGYHYNNGKAIITRGDSMQEYTLNERRNGEEWIPIDPNPTGNIMKSLSQNARNQGEIITVEWRNGDTGYLEPGHPLNYQYFYDDESVMIRKGILLGYRTDFVPITSGASPIMKRTTMLTIFLKTQERYTS